MSEQHLDQFLKRLGGPAKESKKKQAFVYKAGNSAEPSHRKSAVLMNLLYGYYDECDVFQSGMLRGRLTISEIRELVEAICQLPDEY